VLVLFSVLAFVATLVFIRGEEVRQAPSAAPSPS
jgi:hypothetical protein